MKVNLKKSRVYELMIVILFIGIFVNTYSRNTKLKKNIKKEVIAYNKDLNYKDSISNMIYDLRIKYPHIVLAQILLESNNFKSEVFKENNNPFGFRMPGSRVTTAKGIRNGYAYYDSLRDAVLDYAFYQTAFYRQVSSEEEYYLTLNKSYSKDENYISKIKKIANSLKN